MPAAPPDPSWSSIRAAAIAAVEASPELGENPLIKFLQTMMPEQEEVAEHLLGRDRREVEAELERIRAEDQSAA